MTENQNLDPETFDLDDWLIDAALPEESVDVYKRADVISELSELKRRIEELQDAGNTGEQTAGEKSERSKLEARYTDLLNTFGNSRLTVYVSAIPGEHRKSLLDAHNARVESGEIPKEQDGLEFGWLILSESIVGVKKGDGDRRPVRWTVAQVKKLKEKVGEVQLLELTKAQRIAQNAIPEVDADFLLTASGTNSHGTEA
ncbi:hypothetical protein [Zhihengliuella flava]|uniref:Uncharacterized protein n=1 Tax=Zhihengliuella flava TaxID=1285193 RepID=A0A931DCC0_9MICC|nr:hypothetical protein [Zhihengliuella flava]MBG6085812.1 hypothetical protein [Zhihengliuella flava]